jgi:hypothetical protein
MKTKREREDKRSDKRTVITSLKMSNGRVVTDPHEINELLIADGFTIDEDGKLGVGPKLRGN